MTPPHQLGGLQVAILRALWARGEAAVSQIHADLKVERDLAPTTVATVLSRMEKKGLVSHRSEGRQFIYRPRVTEDEVRDSLVSDLTDLLFEGDPAELMNHLLSAREFTAGDLARARAMLEDKSKETDGEEDGHA